VIFKIANQDWEFEAIHRLNYETFVEEIPQHGRNPEGRLVDKFHHQNTYVVATRGRELLGMLAVRDVRPFSLDSKLPDLDSHLPPGQSLCEIRLLAIRKNQRNSMIYKGLMQGVRKLFHDNGYDIGVISGLLDRVRLYERMGFLPFGPLVGTEQARFQPMLITPVQFDKYFGDKIDWQSARLDAENTQTDQNFLPGPVKISPIVQKALSRPPVSHRSASFMAFFQKVRQKLCLLNNARHVEIMTGSGTLANDVVAAQLSLLPGKGLVLVNGEFGKRLASNAKGMRLNYEAWDFGWARPIDYAAVERRLEQEPEISWLWTPHCETSTGMVNDIARLADIAHAHGAKLALDCVSSIGAIPVDLSRVYLASGTSGKGLASFAGLAMVYYNHELPPYQNALPRYLDLSYYRENDGVAFTLPTNLVFALDAALDLLDIRGKAETTARMARQVRQELRHEGFSLLVPDELVLDAVVTIEMPEGIDSVQVGDALLRQGIQLSYKSRYLAERNHIQICFMGMNSEQSIRDLVPMLREAMPKVSA